MSSRFREENRSSGDRSGSTEQSTDRRPDRQPSKQTGGTIRASHPIVEVGNLSRGQSGYGSDDSVLESQHTIEHKADEMARAVASHPLRQRSVAGERRGRRSYTADFDDRDAVGSHDDSTAFSTGDLASKSARESRSYRTGHESTPASQYAGSIDRVTGGGRQLPTSVRTDFESRFGTTLGDVRIHTSTAAGQLAAAVGARAFTHGNHVVFGPDEFRPHTAAGRHLLAHELAHVLQWRAGLLGDGTIARMNSDNQFVSSQEASPNLFEMFLAYGFDVCPYCYKLLNYGITSDAIFKVTQKAPTRASMIQYLSDLLKGVSIYHQRLPRDRFSKFIAAFNLTTEKNIIPEIYEKVPIRLPIRFGMPNESPFTQSVTAIADSGAGTSGSHIMMSSKTATDLGIKIPSGTPVERTRNWDRTFPLQIKVMSATIGEQYYPSLTVSIAIGDERDYTILRNPLIQKWMIGGGPGIVFRYTNPEQASHLAGTDILRLGRAVRILPGNQTYINVSVERPSRTPSSTSAGTISSTPSHQQQQSSVKLLVDTGAFMSILSERVAFEKGLTPLDSRKFGWERTRDGLYTIQLLDSILQRNNYPPVTEQSVESATTHLQAVANALIDSPNQVLDTTLLGSPEFGKIQGTLKQLRDYNRTSSEQYWITKTMMYHLIPDYVAFKNAGGKVTANREICIRAKITIDSGPLEGDFKLHPHESVPSNSAGAIGEEILRNRVVGPPGIGFEF